MRKKILSLGSEGKLILKGPDGKMENIPDSRSAFVYLLIDCSGSMEGTKLSQAKKGAISFTNDALKKGYFVGLIKFSSIAKLMCEPEVEFNTLCSCLETLIAGGSTNMTDGIKMAMERLSTKKGLRAMVVVTDGAPDDPKTTLNAAQQVKEKGIDIIVIGTDDADRDFINKLASRAELSIKVSSDQFGQGIASTVKMLQSTRK